ncbi:MAG: aminoglycoside phosphotransferase family protein [Chloroflexia bacterium]
MSGAISGEDPIKRRDRYIMLGHILEPKVFMLRNGDKWTLPHFVPDERDVVEVGHVVRKANKLWGMDATVLRCARYYADIEVEKRTEAVFAMENHSKEWNPPLDGQWVDNTLLRDLELVIPEHRETIQTWLTERETGSYPAQRSPWAKEGWLSGVQSWIEQELSHLGIAATGQVRQVKTWSISCLLTVETNQGAIYFKAVPPIFSQEPLITSEMTRLFPKNVPAPLVTRIEPTESWMLLRDFAAPELRGNADMQQWAEALKVLSRMQIASIAEVDALLTGGCADRRLQRLVEHIDPLLDDPDAVGELESEEVEKLKAFAPRLKEMCAQLAAYGVPQTLIHGDFYGGNVVVKDGRYIVFDWTDAAVAHPFFDLPTFFEFDIPLDQRETLAQAYLRLWTDHETGQRLQEAYRLSQPLALMHHAVSYRNIVAVMEPSSRWEMFGGSTSWLRMLLKWIMENAADVQKERGDTSGLV